MKDRNKKKGILNYFKKKKAKDIIFGMRKIYYLSRDLEEKDYKLDPVRFELICYELFRKIRH